MTELDTIPKVNMEEAVDAFVRDIYAADKVHQEESDFYGLPIPESTPKDVVDTLSESVQEVFAKINEFWGGIVTIEEAIGNDDDALLVAIGSVLGFDSPKTNEQLKGFLEHYELEWPGIRELGGTNESLELELRESVYDLPWDWKITERTEDALEEAATGENEVYQELVRFFQQNPSKPGSVAQTVYFAAEDAVQGQPGVDFNDWMTRFLRFMASRI
jgi:hypothetical protein